MKIKTFLLTTFFISVLNYAIKASTNDDTKLATWYRIKTPHYNIIFRSSFMREAQRMADTLEYLYIPISKSLGVQHEPIDVLYDNKNLDLNGSTSRNKMVMYSFPPSDYNFAGAHDWLLFLTSHELRHTAQNNAEKQGLIKLVYWLGGNIFISNYVSTLSGTPKWFYEGDAVCTETALSNYGRGRLPFYLMNYKSILLEGPDYNYYKAFNRSYKDQVPNPYILGYVMTAHMRRNYGVDVIKDIFYQMGSTGRLIFPLAVKKVTGQSLTHVYRDAKNELRQLWGKQLEDLRITQSETINGTDSNDYIDYMHPQYSDASKIIALKINKYGRYEFISIDPKTHKEKIVVEPYLLQEKTSTFSVVENLIAWIERRFPILSAADNKEIKDTAIILYDMSAKKNKKKVIAKGRYLSACISHSKKYIAAVVSTESYDHYISIIEIETGKEVTQLKNPENKLYQAPTWSEDDKSIISVVAHNSKSSIEVINLETGVASVVMEPSTEHIGNATQHKNYIYYGSAYSGIDNIYAIDINTKKRYQVTSKTYGAFSPNISSDGAHMYFSNYTKNGLQVDVSSLNSTEWLPIEQVKNISIHYEKPLEEQEGNIKISPDAIPHKEYIVERYYPILHLFKIQGWMPDIISWAVGAFGSEKELNPYFLFDTKFEDLNSWLVQTYSYKFLLKDKNGEVAAEYKFPAIYPQLTIKGALTHQAFDLITHKSLAGTIAFPLHFPLGSFDSVFIPSLSPNIIWANNTYEEIKKVAPSVNRIMSYILDYSITSNFPYYIVSPLKFRIGGIYQTTDKGIQFLKKEKNYQNDCWGSQLKFNLPSFIENNVFIFKSVYQKKNPFKSEGPETNKKPIKWHSSNLAFIKNLKCRPLDTYEGEMFSNRVSYVFPIYYPDLDLGYFSYFKRISSTLFTELTHFPEAKFFKRVLTFGVDVYFQFSILSRDLSRGDNYPFNIYLGYSYTPDAFIEADHNYRHKFSVNLRIQSERTPSKIEIYEYKEKSENKNERHRAGYQ